MSVLTVRSIKRKLGIAENLVGTELNILDGVTATATEVNKLAGVTAGTVTASKALVVDANKDLASLRNITATGTAIVDTITATTITGTAIGANAIVKSSANQSFTSGDTGATLTNLTGLVQTVVPGTYKYRVFLPGVSTANSGMKVAFKLTTTVLTSIENTGKLATASALAVQHTTTTTDQTSLAAGTAANILVELEGTMVVGTGGTIQIQGAQNASHADTTTFYLGGTFELVRIA